MLDLLKRVGWTQAELARDLGASKNTVANWCSGSETVACRAAIKYLECLARGMGR